MEFAQVLGIRRSIRYFDPDRPVEREKIQKILEAMRIASCAMNTHWLRAIVVYRDELPEETFEIKIGDIDRTDLGLTPVNDGKIIRVSIPPLTEQRRVELVKVVKKMAENCKVSIRNHRRDINEDLKLKKKDKEFSEDEFFKGQKEVQDITDDYIKKCDELTQAKEKEILEF